MKKLILFCLMLISGLTQAQEFDFNCEPDVLDTSIGLYLQFDDVIPNAYSGSIIDYDTKTASGTYTLPDSHVIGHTVIIEDKSFVPFVYSVTAIEGESIISWSITVPDDHIFYGGADSIQFDIILKTAYPNLDYTLNIKIGDSNETMTASKTVDFGTKEIVLDFAIPEGHSIPNAQSAFNAIDAPEGWTINVPGVGAGATTIQTIITFAEDTNFYNPIVNEVDFSSWITTDAPDSYIQIFGQVGETAEAIEIAAGGIKTYYEFIPGPDAWGTVEFVINDVTYTVTFDDYYESYDFLGDGSLTVSIEDDGEWYFHWKNVSQANTITWEKK